MAKQVFICSDNIERLRLYPDNSIDSIVTDAPYGLGKEPDVVKMLTAWLSNGFMEVEGGGFMGKKWDSFVPQPNFWKEVFRVLKPGGHILCFFGTRTYDWGVMAMRIAGFEIRDQIQWLYGSGFPKSLNISKAIDDHFGAEREVIGVASVTGKRLSKTMDDENGKENRTFSNSEPVVNYNTAAATEEAKQWDGYGTALKPANEPIVLARKPIEKGLTIAENVLKWGTGALDIDACRIEFASAEDKQSAVFGRGTNIIGGNYVGATHSDGRTNVPPDDKGRFPANILLDEEAAMFLDQQTGTLTSGKPSGMKTAGNNDVYGKFGSVPVTGYGDSGGASRFFYVAKASKAERNKGVTPTGAGHAVKMTSKGGAWQCNDCDRKYAFTLSTCPKCGGENRTLYEVGSLPVANTHPTVKPVSLMQYLVRLVTPPGGICLDPFNGSGTTGLACTLDNINYIGIDNTEEYIEISEARKKAWKNAMSNQISMF